MVGIGMNATLPWFFYYGTPPAERISFAWVGIPGMVVAALIVLVGSRFDSRKQTQLAGLTSAHCRRQTRTAQPRIPSKKLPTDYLLPVNQHIIMLTTSSVLEY